MSDKSTLFKLTAVVLLSQCFVQTSNAQNTRQIFVQRINKLDAEFFVRVSVDREDHTYQANEEVRITVQSGREGYLYLFNLQKNNQVVCLFPNNVQTENRISAIRKIQIPAENADFRFRVAAPFGTEIIKAVVTKNPLKSLEPEQLSKQPFTLVDSDTLKNIVVDDLRPERDWSAHQVQITTVASRGNLRQSRSERIGLFIGCGEYGDHRVPNIPVCRNDAQQIRQTMLDRCKLDRTYLLVDKEATLENVKKLFDRVVAESKPGDEIIIFWSGHGARFSDEGGEEKDGFDEIYLLHDSNVSNVQTTRCTCVTDDMLGNWIIRLVDRKVLVILDTCHSGGAANNEKGFDLQFVKIPDGIVLDLIDNDLNRTKDIGQRNVVVLASSRARQKSFVRTEGDMSVLSYELNRLLKLATGRITIQSAHQSVAQLVPEYTKNRYDAVQTPVLIGDEKMPFALVP